MREIEISDLEVGVQLCHMCCARSVLNLPSSCAAVQHLSHLGFFFFFWEFDGRIKNLNSQNSFVSKNFKAWAFSILVKLID